MLSREKLNFIKSHLHSNLETGKRLLKSTLENHTSASKHSVAFVNRDFIFIVAHN